MNKFPNDSDEPEDVEGEHIKKHYFKIDVSNLNSFWGFSEWIKDVLSQLDVGINYIPGFPVVSFPVNDLIPNTEGGVKSPLYLGNNHFNEGVWKMKYFVFNPIQTHYIKHLESHAVHFVSQPSYYRGLYDILN